MHVGDDVCQILFELDEPILELVVARVARRVRVVSVVVVVGRFFVVSESTRVTLGTFHGRTVLGSRVGRSDQVFDFLFVVGDLFGQLGNLNSWRKLSVNLPVRLGEQDARSSGGRRNSVLTLLSWNLTILSSSPPRATRQ